jgi:Rha family phage regulatory protein
MNNSLVIAGNGHAKTNTLLIATAFGKQHKNVLQSVEALQVSESFRKLNFQPSTYEVENSQKKYPMYEVTRDGWMMLVMGFTGKEATRVKEQFIVEFNAMEELLLAGSAQPALPGNLAQDDMAERLIKISRYVRALYGLGGCHPHHLEDMTLDDFYGLLLPIQSWAG